MEPRKAAAVIAVGVLIVAIVVGFWPLSTDRGYVQDGSADVACGSAFTGVSDEAESASTAAGIRESVGLTPGEDAAAACSDALGTQRTIALVVGGVALAALAFVGLTSRSASRPGPSRDGPDPALNI